jgi:hypothetical protein
MPAYCLVVSCLYFLLIYTIENIIDSHDYQYLRVRKKMYLIHGINPIQYQKSIMIKNQPHGH